MNNPDFSNSPQHVALAKVLYLAHKGDNEDDWWELTKSAQAGYLRMADAAITHLGSGYRLPEANEANAERLAKEFNFGTQFFEMPQDWRAGWTDCALRWLRALHAAFGDAEKPEPNSKPKVDDATSLSPTERGERRRERQRLAWEATLAAISGPVAMSIDSKHLVIAGTMCADAYLAWRAADDKKDTEAYKK